MNIDTEKLKTLANEHMRDAALFKYCLDIVEGFATMNQPRPEIRPEIAAIPANGHHPVALPPAPEEPRTTNARRRLRYKEKRMRQPTNREIEDRYNWLAETIKAHPAGLSSQELVGLAEQSDVWKNADVEKAIAYAARKLEKKKLLTITIMTRGGDGPDGSHRGYRYALYQPRGAKVHPVKESVRYQERGRRGAILDRKKEIVLGLVEETAGGILAHDMVEIMEKRGVVFPQATNKTAYIRQAIVDLVKEGKIRAVPVGTQGRQVVNRFFMAKPGRRH